MMSSSEERGLVAAGLDALTSHICVLDSSRTITLVNEACLAAGKTGKRTAIDLCQGGVTRRKRTRRRLPLMDAGRSGYAR